MRRFKAGSPHREPPLKVDKDKILKIDSGFPKEFSRSRNIVVYRSRGLEASGKIDIHEGNVEADNSDDTIESRMKEKVETGVRRLDSLLYGGIPRGYAVILTSPPYDERDAIISRFLEAGLKRGEIVFLVSNSIEKTFQLIEKNPSTFHAFFCNPSAEQIAQSLPNVSSLPGIEFTSLNMAISSVLENVKSRNISKRIVITLLSDALLSFGADATRKWLTSLIPSLKKDGFTFLATLNPYMHGKKETQAIIDIFDGQIDIYEDETYGELRLHLRIKRMYNQQFSPKSLLIGISPLGT